jgi:Uma2 family endonuclease
MSAAPRSVSQPPASPSVPPLQDGDRLTREEFERRYDAMPGLKKAELINGVVFLPPQGRTARHGGACAHLVGWLGLYHADTPGMDAGANSSIRLTESSMPQPDACLFREVTPDGGGRVDADDYIAGPPDLVAEVAASSAGKGLREKRDAYREAGVPEYIVWRLEETALDWYILRSGQYVALAPGADGVLRSETFPGLWLDVAALLRSDMAAVLRVVQQGIAGPEHAAFVGAAGS